MRSRFIAQKHDTTRATGQQAIVRNEIQFDRSQTYTQVIL